nr:desulfoferrodoxin family protein [uncultured Dysosmobacter sp.]
MKFYICEHCGNIVTKLTSAGVPIKCCGTDMVLLEAGVTDAAVEKHVPVVTVDGNLVKVNVGSVTHPMTAEHYIQWAVVETEQDALIHWFQPDQAPEAVFALADGQKAKAVYAYCNLHGLWKQDL